MLMIEKLYEQRARRMVLKDPALRRFEPPAEKEPGKLARAHELANHHLGHVRLVAELYRAPSFYPCAGSYQRYSNPKP